MWCLIGFAFAQTTYNLPNASHSENGFNGSFGTGVAALRSGPLPSVRTTFSYNQDNLGVFLTNTIYQGVYTEGFDVLSLKYNVVNRDGFRFAPTIMLADHWGISSMDYRLTARVGFAVETGKDQWLWDLSANIVGRHYRPDFNSPTISKMTILDTVLAIETGLRYKWDDSHFLRLGLLGPMPSFRYSKPMKGTSIEVTGATLGTQHLLQLDVRM